MKKRITEELMEFLDDDLGDSDALISDVEKLAQERQKKIKREQREEDQALEEERLAEEQIFAEERREQDEEVAGFQEIRKQIKAKGRPKKSDVDSREEREQKAITLSSHELKEGIQDVRRALATEYSLEVQYAKEHKPKTRGDCFEDRKNGDGTLGPCPWVSCEHHLLLDVNELSGSLKINFPEVIHGDEIDLSKMPATCVLDVAAVGGVTLEETGKYLGMTRERVRQVERDAMLNLAEKRRAAALFLVICEPVDGELKGQDTDKLAAQLSGTQVITPVEKVIVPAETVIYTPDEVDLIFKLKNDF